jgi:hypothetical protein
VQTDGYRNQPAWGDFIVTGDGNNVVLAGHGRGSRERSGRLRDHRSRAGGN